VSFKYLLVGNSGTGKTTVARKMRKRFKALGPDDTVLDISASNLVTGYVGQAGKMTHDQFQKSRGGVLFINEGHLAVRGVREGGQALHRVLGRAVHCAVREGAAGLRYPAAGAGALPRMTSP
jgi:SpoVK/Ycf46/Vps4 family AAA+-type ATPase